MNESPPPKSPPFYTLAPLIKDGPHCLMCKDIKGMESAVLERVEFYYSGSPWQRIVRQSDDVFALVERQIIKWPTLDRIVAARFRIRLKNDRRTRRITIRPALRPLGIPDSASPIVEEWLQKRKFMETQTDEGKSVE